MINGSVFFTIFAGIVFLIFKEKIWGFFWRTKKLEDYKEKKRNQKFRKEIK